MTYEHGQLPPIPQTSNDDGVPAKEPNDRRQQVVGRVLVVTSIAVVLVAVVIGAVGLNARSAADDDRARVSVLQKEHRAQAQTRTAAVHDEREVNKRADAVFAALTSLHDALDTNSAAQHRFADSINHGADVFNAGDTAGSEAIFRDEVTPALTDLAQRRVELRAALTALHAARDDLEEVLR